MFCILLVLFSLKVVLFSSSCCTEHKIMHRIQAICETNWGSLADSRDYGRERGRRNRIRYSELWLLSPSASSAAKNGIDTSESRNCLTLISLEQVFWENSSDVILYKAHSTTASTTIQLHLSGNRERRTFKVNSFVSSSTYIKHGKTTRRLLTIFMILDGLEVNWFKTEGRV